MKKIFTMFVLFFMITVGINGQTTINFDISGNWIQDGATVLSSYGNHAYSESGVSLQGTNVLRNTTSSQDGFAGALGTYSFRIRNASGAKLTITIPSGGVSTFSFAIRRWDASPMPNYSVNYSTDGGSNWTSLTSVDGTLLTTSDWFTYNETINKTDAVVIEIANTGTTERIMVDDFIWSAYSAGGVNNPSLFSASAGSTPNDIDLSWAQNGNSDNVMVAFNTSNTFGTPSDGTTYAVNDGISGGGTVIFNGANTSFNHSGLTANTTYYYKAWSVDGSTNYSAGTETNATTAKEEPTNHVTGFAATVGSSSQINLTWTDASGGVLPDNYLIQANKTGTFSDPVDGTEQVDATDANGGTVNVSQGTALYNWTGLTASTQYFFKIWPYTNSGSHINYKTNGTVPIANATTDVATTVPNLVISEIMQNPTSVADGSGEWFEIYNTEASDINIDGYIIKDNGSDSHTINNGGALNIPAKGFIVLGINDAAGTNGGLTVDYKYTGFTLANSDDEIVLVFSDGSTIVDKVEYDGGPNFPDPTGASMVLTDLSADNNVGSNWTTATLREGTYSGSDTDLGSPGVRGSEATETISDNVSTGSNVIVLVNGNKAGINKITFTNVTGAGSLSIKNYGQAPSGSVGVTGNVSQYRWVIANSGVTFDVYSMRFDINSIPNHGIVEGADDLHLYSRETPGSGTFSDLGLLTYNDNGTVGNQADDYLTISGLTHFSEFVFGSVTAALPVELTSFTANVLDNSVVLAWQTATEVNNYGFEIQRTSNLRGQGTQNGNGDLEGYQTIGFVNGNGNSNSPKSYSYTDNSAVAGNYSYRLKQIDVDGKFEYSDAVEVQIGAPDKFELSQNYPNPFNPSTLIKYSLPTDGFVQLKVYDILGNEVADLVNKNISAGAHEVLFDASKLSSGIYFYTIKVNNFRQTRKMQLLK